MIIKPILQPQATIPVPVLGKQSKLDVVVVVIFFIVVVVVVIVVVVLCPR